MTTFKLVISDPRTGLSIQREAKDPAASKLVGLKIGDKVKGELIDLAGYEFEITGGSDYCGFPMRKDVAGIGRKRILAVEGVGIKRIGKGIKQRKTVCGNTIHTRISQINMKVVKEGAEKIFEAKAAEKKEKGKEKKGKSEEKVVPEKKETKEELKEKKEEKGKKEKPEKAAKVEKKKQKTAAEEKPKEEKKE
jgi:small subunit ribosomal protein S6e